MGKKYFSDKPRIYLDFDGVLADFAGEAARRRMTTKELKLVQGAYRRLRPLAGATDAIREWSNLEVLLFGLTKIPAENPFAATEKLLWAQEHFPELADRIIISPDKGAVGSRRDVLIDDHPEWANAKKFPGRLIHFKGDWPGTLALLRDILRG